MVKNFILKKYTNNRGSILVETAIILPFFLIALIAVSFIVNLVSIEEKVFYESMDETRLVVEESYLLKTNPIFKLKLKNRINKEVASKIDDLKIEKFKYLYAENNIDDLISFEIDYRIPIIFLPKSKAIKINNSILCRGFRGKNFNNDPMSFDELKTDKNFEEVWIFPHYGEKYHKKDCPYILVNPSECLLTE